MSSILAPLSGLGIRRCCELWCRLQTRLGSRVAVAVVRAGSGSSNSTASLGTSMCRRYGPKKKKRETKQRNLTFKSKSTTLRETSPTKIDRKTIAREKTLHIACHQGMQINTTMKCHDAPIRRAKIQGTNHTESWQGCGATGAHRQRQGRTGQTLWKFGVFFKNCTFTLQSSNHVPCYSPKGVENLYLHSYLHPDVYSSFE